MAERPWSQLHWDHRNFIGTFRMDISSLVGCILGVVLIGIVGAEACHGHWMMFYSLEGVLLVFGGSISVSFMALPLDRVKSIPSYCKRFLFNKSKGSTV